MQSRVATALARGGAPHDPALLRSANGFRAVLAFSVGQHTPGIAAPGVIAVAAAAAWLPARRAAAIDMAITVRAEQHLPSAAV